MIEKVTLHNFKMFREETFDVSDSIILAGPNNTGKTSLLQAIAVWNLALRKWIAERSGSAAKKRTGVAVTRKDFTAIPLREMNLLWTDCSTALTKEDEKKEEKKAGSPRMLKIGITGCGAKGSWSLSFEFNYQNSELVYTRPSKETPVENIKEAIKDLQVVHVPPFSGIGVEETRFDRGFQDHLIGQSKPGDILRNLLLDVYNAGKEEWNELSKNIDEMFGYRLLPPVYSPGHPFIVCDYQQDMTRKRASKFDISCAGSGFLQVLMILGFFYARPATILLLDEPDAHLHVILQKQVYDWLREIAYRRGCQLLIATHSEVLIDSTSPERIVCFYKKPHRLMTDTDRDQVREALKRLTSLDILQVHEASGVLYIEGETDFNLLREWARVLVHPAYNFFFLAENPLWHSNEGRHPREAKNHFFALKAVNDKIRGVLILDGDNRQLPDHEVSAEGLTILRWKRYEAESYLIHPEALARFIETAQLHDLFAYSSISKERGLEYLEKELPRGVYENPLEEHPFFEGTPASKTLLPEFFKEAGVPLTKNEYYQVAAQMLPEEIPEEVKEKLDSICEALEIKRTP